MNKIATLITIFLLITVLSQGQTCSCQSDFDWMRKTFEENDAGFKYIIDTKGGQAYLDHNAKFDEKLKSVTNNYECADLMREWLSFFRAGHIGIVLNPVQSTNSWETLSCNIEEFESYLKNKKEKDLEGIWETGVYKIGIRKSENGYTGFIIESGNKNWNKYEVKLKIRSDKGKLTSTFFLGDKSSIEIKTIELLANNTLMNMDGIFLKRIFPQSQNDEPVEKYIELITSSRPFIEELNSTTLLFRIPSFDVAAKKAIDSVISVNKNKLFKTKNLIIDLRYNGGGGDGSYQELLPLIYTNPIQTIGVERLSTKLNNQLFLAEHESNAFERMWAKKRFNELENNLGSFVLLNDNKISTYELKDVYPYPENIAIIINDGCGSTTEQFLLAARQSKKVKFYGTTTKGVLDFSNMKSVNSPCQHYRLNFCVTKSLRIPENAIDGKGIEPDYYLDKNIDPSHWVEFVKNELNKN